VSLSLDEPIIYLITKGETSDSNFDDARREILEIARLAVEEKVSLIQIREKQLSARLLFELTSAAAEITFGSSTCLLVNDRADIALAAKADGVQLAANSLHAAVVRKNFPKEFVIGASTHTLEAAVDASRQGADFAVFGPVFETPGKGKLKGLDKLAEVCDKLRPFPVIAIGGINASNCKSVLAAGASGIAAIRALNDSESFKAIIDTLRK
jgi:thiamine-phosphate pyrophosphorylase